MEGPPERGWMSMAITIPLGAAPPTGKVRMVFGLQLRTLLMLRMGSFVVSDGDNPNNKNELKPADLDLDFVYL